MTEESQIQSRKNQCVRILEFCNEHGSITQEDCDNMRPKIKRLASRISQMQKENGIMFKHIPHYAKGGDKYTEYVLIDLVPLPKKGTEENTDGDVK